MTQTRRRKRGLRYWLRRNSLSIILAVLIMGLCIGVFVLVVSALSPADVTDEPITTTVPPLTTTALPVDVPSTEVITEEVEEVVFYFDIPLDNELQDYIRNLCESYDVPMELVIAMIYQESSFRAGVVSGSDDYGLMQINTINHEWLQEELGITDFLDPYQNVLCGIHIISGHLAKTDGDIELALMRYNCGATGAKRLWDKGIYQTDYTQKIMTYYEFYKQESRPTDCTP